MVFLLASAQTVNKLLLFGVVGGTFCESAVKWILVIPYLWRRHIRILWATDDVNVATTGYDRSVRGFIRSGFVFLQRF